MLAWRLGPRVVNRSKGAFPRHACVAIAAPRVSYPVRASSAADAYGGTRGRARRRARVFPGTTTSTPLTVPHFAREASFWKRASRERLPSPTTSRCFFQLEGECTRRASRTPPRGATRKAASSGPRQPWSRLGCRVPFHRQRGLLRRERWNRLPGPSLISASCHIEDFTNQV